MRSLLDPNLSTTCPLATTGGTDCVQVRLLTRISGEVLVEESGGGFEEVVGSDNAHEMIAFNDGKTTNPIAAHDFDRLERRCRW